MAPKSVTFRRHDHLVSVLFGDLLSHSYNITFSMFLYLVNFCVDCVYSISTDKTPKDNRACCDESVLTSSKMSGMYATENI